MPPPATDRGLRGRWAAVRRKTDGSPEEDGRQLEESGTRSRILGTELRSGIRLWPTAQAVGAKMQNFQAPKGRQRGHNLARVVTNHPLRHAARLSLAFVLDNYGKYGFTRVAQVGKRLQCETAANLRSGANRRGKTNPVQPIIHGHANPVLNPQRLLRKVAEQRKCQETMRDGDLVGRLALGALAIQVNPLTIFRRLGELLNAVLCHQQPISRG